MFINNNFTHQWTQGSEWTNSWIIWNRISLIKNDSSKVSSAEKAKQQIYYSNDKLSKVPISNLLNLNEINKNNNQNYKGKVKTRNIQIIKSSTLKTQDKLLNPDYIYLNLKSLSDRLMSISNAHPNLHPILESITNEYKDLFYIQKRKHDEEIYELK